MALTTTGTLSSVVKAYYDRRFLMRAEANFVYKQLGRQGVIPKGEGNTVVWNRYTNPTAKITALTEGTDPTPAGLSATLVSATIAQYGNFEQITDVLSLTSIDNSIASAVDLLAYEAAISIDTVVRDVIDGTTSILYASGVANRTSLIATDIVTVTDVRKVVRELKSNNAKPQAKSGSFMAVIHPDVEYDLQGDSAWTDAHTYTDSGLKGVYNGEVGKLYGVRFLNTTQAPVLTNSGSAGVEVYQSLFFGEEAFGVSELQNLSTFVDSPSPRSALRLYSDVGWKAGFATSILNDAFMYSLESGATQ
ncbi:MAG: N4-gp56 family major capsid protein [Candidatus Thorarchaeota archaeon]|nr:MAG: N4-gp56 family major capsid protein [Candidatus Thorarchaeota archaeon]